MTNQERALILETIETLKAEIKANKKLLETINREDHLEEWATAKSTITTWQMRIKQFEDKLNG